MVINGRQDLDVVVSSRSLYYRCMHSDLDRGFEYEWWIGWYCFEMKEVPWSMNLDEDEGAELTMIALEIF